MPIPTFYKQKAIWCKAKCTQFLQGFSPPSSWNVVVLLWPELIFIILVLFPTFFNPDEFSLHYIYQLLFFKIPIKLDDIWLCCFHFPHFKFCWFLLPNSIFAILTHNFWHQYLAFSNHSYHPNKMETATWQCSKHFWRIHASKLSLWKMWEIASVVCKKNMWKRFKTTSY